MCLSNKFCFIVSLELGCLIIGISTLILSVLALVASIILLYLEQQCPGCGGEYLQSFPKLVLDTVSINIILSTIALLAVFLLFFSGMLLIGIRKNKSSFVLAYFTYGTMLTIICVLSSLLVLLHGHWVLSLIKWITTLFYIHCLVVVHSTYDLMVTGTQLKYSNLQNSDETLLVE